MRDTVCIMYARTCISTWLRFHCYSWYMRACLPADILTAKTVGYRVTVLSRLATVSQSQLEVVPHYSW